MINYNVFFTVILCVLFAGCKKEEPSVATDPTSKIINIDPLVATDPTSKIINIDPLVATDPTSKIINIDGHDFVIRGDIDGEEFVIKHESNVQSNIRRDIVGGKVVITQESNDQYNRPSNNETSFGTFFKLKYPGKEKYISLGITKNGDSKFEDVVQVRNYEWYGFDVPTQSVGEVFINDIKIKDDGSADDVADPFPTNSDPVERVINNITFKDDGSVHYVAAPFPTNKTNPDNRFEITSITPLELDENLDKIYSGKLYKVEGNFSVNLEKYDNSEETRRLTVEYFSAIFHDNSL